ncbi:MAG: SDR family oxidoreductase [Bacteroidota bacterium]
MKQKVLITGGSKGIGKAIAERFYRGGFEVLVCARGQAGLDRLSEELPGVHTFVCDIAQKEAILGLCQQVEQEFGGLDLLINNGGQYVQGDIHQASDEAYHSLMRTNVDSAFYFSRELVKPMIKRKKGSIVIMASVASLQAYEDGGLYSVSKYAMMGLARNLRAELAKHQIRVMTLFPGAVKTPSWDWADLSEERFIPAADIAELIWTSYHLSDRTVVEDLVVRPAAGDI